MGGYHRLGAEAVEEGHWKLAKEALWVRSLAAMAVVLVLRSAVEVVVWGPRLEEEVAAQEHLSVVVAVVLVRLLVAMVEERVLRLAGEEVVLAHSSGVRVAAVVLSLAGP